MHVNNLGSGLATGIGRSAINRTGATTVVGGCYALDIHQSQSESTNMDTGSAHLVPVTTGLIAAGLFVVATEAADDNKQCRFQSGEGIKVKLLVNGNSANIAKGDPLKAVNGQPHCVKATAGTDRYHFIAGEAATADGVLIDAVMVAPAGTR